MRDITLVPMRRAHLRAVQRIEEAVYPRPWTPGLFRSELALSDQRTYLVAQAGNRIVGYGGVMYVLPDAHITTMAVDPDCQRDHIGTRILLGLCRAAIDAGATALTLEVRVTNEAAQALYRRFGFAPAGARKGYYPPLPGATESEDALVMWVHDIDHPDFADRLDTITSSLGRTQGART